VPVMPMRVERPLQIGHLDCHSRVRLSPMYVYYYCRRKKVSENTEIGGIEDVRMAAQGHLRGLRFFCDRKFGLNSRISYAHSCTIHTLSRVFFGEC